jgi:hypothetical protein
MLFIRLDPIFDAALLMTAPRLLASALGSEELVSGKLLGGKGGGG